MARVGRAAVEVYAEMGNFASQILNEIGGIAQDSKLGSDLAAQIEQAISGVSAEVPVDFEASSLDGVLSNVQGAFQGISDMGSRALSGLGTIASKTVIPALSSAGAVLGDAISTSANMALAGVGAAAGAVATQVVGGGASRAMSLNQAEAQLKALGYAGAELDAVMQSAIAGVEGTSFMTADAAAASTAFLTAGVAPGEELTGVLRNISNVAAQSGSDFGEIAPIMQRVASTGKLMGNEINMLEQRNIPIVTALADEYGVAEESIRDMASAGEIGFGDMQRALANSNLIADAETMASLDFGQSFSNVRAYLGMLSEPFWSASIEGIIPVFNRIRDILSEIIESNAWKNFVNPKVEAITGFFENMLSWLEGIDPTTLFNTITNGIENMRYAILPLAGLVLGFAGSILSSVPVIGRVFAGLTGPVGLVIGIFAGAVAYSERLQEAFSGLRDAFGTLFTAIGNAFGGEGDFIGDFLGMIGDNLAVAVNYISDFVEKAAPLVQEFLGDLLGGSGFTGIGSFFAGIGNLLSNAFGLIMRILTDTGITSAIAGLGNSIIGAVGALANFLGAMADGEGGMASALVTILGGVISGFTMFIDGVTTIVNGLNTLVNSPAASGFSAFVGDLISAVAGNEMVMKGIGVLIATALGAFLIAPLVVKVIGVVRGLMAFASMLGIFGARAAVATAGPIARFGASLSALGTAIVSGATALVAATPVLLKAVLAFTTVGAAIIGSITALGSMLRSEVVREAITALIEVFSQVLESLQPIFDNIIVMVDSLVAQLVETLGGVFITLIENLGTILVNLAVGISTVVGTILTALGTFVSTMTGFVYTLLSGVGGILSSVGGIITSTAVLVIGTLAQINNIFGTVLGGIESIIVTFTESVMALMITLSQHGAAGAAGALALAGGLTALAAAMAGGGIGTSAAGVGESILDGLSGGIRSLTGAEKEASGDGFINKIIRLSEALTGVDSIVRSLPETWRMVEAEALTTGANIMGNLTDGVLSRSGEVDNAITTAVRNALSAAQAEADRNPIVYRMEIDRASEQAVARRMASAASRSSRAAASGTSGRTTNVTNNIRSNDPEVVGRYVSRAFGGR